MFHIFCVFGAIGYLTNFSIVLFFIKVAVKVKSMWCVRAGLLVVEKKSISNFSASGFPNNATRRYVTGKLKVSKEEIQVTDRNHREETRKSTEEAIVKPAPRSRKCLWKRVVTKKATKFEALLPTLFEIGLRDELQPPDKLPFLLDQRSERKSRLPVLTNNKTGTIFSLWVANPQVAIKPTGG